jgi:hypothetical protein
MTGFSSSSFSESGISLWGRHEVWRPTIIGETNTASYKLYIYLFVCFWRDCPKTARVSSFMRFLDPTQRRATVGRTPLNEWSARRRDLYLKTHNAHNRQTSKPAVGFEPTISPDERQQIYALGRAATGIGKTSLKFIKKKKRISPSLYFQFVFCFIYSQCLGWHTEEKLDFGCAWTSNGQLSVHSTPKQTSSKILLTN